MYVTIILMTTDPPNRYNNVWPNRNWYLQRTVFFSSPPEYHAYPMFSVSPVIPSR